MVDGIHTVLANVTDGAVWGSLVASGVLGTFMMVQAVIDDTRWRRYLCFGAWCWLVALTDFLRPTMAPTTYEVIRSTYWVLYPGLLIALCGFSIVEGISLAAGMCGLALSIGMLLSPSLVASVVIPCAFLIAAIIHGRYFFLRHGYASAVLTATSGVQAVMCSLYYVVISSGSQTAIVLGYAHYSLVSLVAVVFGWVHLPRELRGLSPVLVSPRLGAAVIVVSIVLEATVQVMLLSTWEYSITAFLGASVVQLGVWLAFYLFNRHELVIYAANVTQLLNERTESLVEAQASLAEQNQVMATKLEEQAIELTTKATVIERQRRLELAAQTAGQAAHDIQNMLSPLFEHSRALRAAANNPEKVAVVASRIERNLSELLDVNGHMLSLARRGRIEMIPLNVGEITEGLEDRFPGAKLTLTVSDEGWVRGSPSQLVRVVVNLVSNAIEASEKSCSDVAVTITTEEVVAVRRCHLGFLNPGSYVCIAVSDRGSGIPLRELDRIFEPFFSLKKSQRGSGSGLGLSIVAAIVEDHGGVLDLTTGIEGTEFSIFLPRIRKPTRDASAAVSGDESLLVIEDHRVIAEEAASWLRSSGYNVTVATSGDAGLRALYNKAYDLVVLDHSMPGMDGLETLFAAIHIRPGTPIILYSGFVSEENLARYQALGISEVLAKPIPKQAFLRAIRVALDEHGRPPRKAHGA